MNRRKDALVGSARMIDAVNRIGHAHAPYACATVGFIQSSPNSRNTIPGKVFFTVDFRHPDDATLTAMDTALRAACADVATAIGLECEVKEFWYFPPTPFDAACVAAVRGAVERAGHPHMNIISGAGHDAVYMARVAPTAMVFVPCENGISHNEVENARPEDLAAGCDVLLQAIVERANAPT
jgi:N-carbamoyl-L-amino-acid hydrolase